MTTLDELRTLPLLAGLEDAPLRQIAVTAADVHLIEGEWLVQEGQQPAFFLLLSGDLEVSKTVAGAEQVINHYHAGDYFGEVPLLLGAPVVASLRATSEVRVLRLDAPVFHDLLACSEKLAAAILQTMTRRVADLQRISVETPLETTLIVGHPADLACYDLRQFLSGNRQDFRWLDPADAAAAALIPAGVGDGPFSTVVLPDGSLLRAPSKREVAGRLGLQTAPQQSAYDTVIIGGGPAGLAAAVYGGSEGLRTLLIEREAPGGQAGTSSRIENYLGFPTGLSGGELAARAFQQARRFGTEIVVTRTVKSLDFPESGGTRAARIILDGGECIQARTVILATGVTWRTLDVPGAGALLGRGIYYGAARTEALGVRGKDVYLIGGGNSAGQAAMFFADYARRVTLLIRASSIEKGMSQYLIRQLATKENVRVELNASVAAVHGDGHLEAITVEQGAASGQTEAERRETDSLFVFIGADAETGWLPAAIARDERGYLLTGLDAQASGKWEPGRDPSLLETSVPGVFAAGDVRHGSIKRVASGVGEGSMAIAFVHQYLALTATSPAEGGLSPAPAVPASAPPMSGPVAGPPTA